MEINLTLAGKLLRLAGGERIPSSALRYALITEMISEGIISDQRTGRSKSILYVTDPEPLHAFLLNRFAINDLDGYVRTLSGSVVTRAELVQGANDSKIRRIRTFKGFLVNCYQPVDAVLSGQNVTLSPEQGNFRFIYDVDGFRPGPDVVIVNVENPENFTYIHRQKYLFGELRALFVCRYPQGQNRDLIRWLLSIPNKYLHFGDLDLAGLNIYWNEYKKHLGERAEFFVPDGVEERLRRSGNPSLYDRQRLNFNISETDEPRIKTLVGLLHRYKKGLEQEVFISEGI